MTPRPVWMLTAIGVVVSVLLSGAPLADGAATNPPPHATLHVHGYGAHQAGIIGSYRATEAGCVGVTKSDGGAYPQPYLVEPGSNRLDVVLHGPQRPSTVAVRIWHRVNRYGEPTGNASHPTSHVRSRHSGRSYEIRFRTRDVAQRDDYVKLVARWRDTQCHATARVPYTFHLLGASGTPTAHPKRQPPTY